MAPILLPRLGRYELPVLSAVFLLALAAFVWKAFFAIRYPANLPRIGSPPGKRGFTWRTYLKYYRDCPGLFRDAYENYGKRGKTVLIPGFGFRTEVVLPHTAMKWVLAQPPGVLNMELGFAEMDQVWYSLGDERYVVDAWHGALVRTGLNTSLENICAALNDELGFAFDQYFGSDTENWKEIELLPTMRKIVGLGASRFTVGLSLCRNEEYIRLNYELIDLSVINAGVTGGSPVWLRPIVGRLISLRFPGRLNRMKQLFEPLYRERMELLKKPEDDPDSSEPRDHLQLMLRYAQKHRPHELEDLDVFTRRLFAANFGSMHQTAIQTTNMLLNILGSDAEFNTIGVLRDEVARVVIGPDGRQEGWTRAKVAQLVRADSAARETLRLNSFGNRAVMRKVMVDGLTTEDGIRLPKGAMVSFLGHPAQTEEGPFEDAFKYDPFRFSRQREAAADADGKPGLGRLSFVSTSPSHLPFGHGVHACPGRFLIDFELKMIIAYVMHNYEIAFPPEYDGKRPPNVWLTEASLPPDGAKVRIRRRKSGTTA